MDDSFWYLAAGVLITLVIGATSCTVQTVKANNDAVTQMVKDGADPIRAACAVGRLSYETCAAAAARPASGAK